MQPDVARVVLELICRGEDDSMAEEEEDLFFNEEIENVIIEED